MTYRLLAGDLHATADTVQSHLRRQHGVSRFKIEMPIGDEFSLTPTLHCDDRDGHILCVEVSHRPHSNTLDTFVLECNQRSFPVRLYVAVPELSTKSVEFIAGLRRAKNSGIGVMSVSATGAHEYHPAMPLSLFGVRDPDPTTFPARKRECVRHAYEIFRGGDPSGGCFRIFQELERVTRDFAISSREAGWWRQNRPGEKGPTRDLEKGAWAAVLNDLYLFLSMPTCKRRCPGMNAGLIGAARGVTDPRNLTGHKPRTRAELARRDQRLRTWFENACDLLRDWCDATKPLRLP